MTDFFREPTSPKARKKYICVACGWFIPISEQHMAQTGVCDGRGFSNRFHDECWDEITEEEFRPERIVTGDYPVPERLKEAAEAYWRERKALSPAQAVMAWISVADALPDLGTLVMGWDGGLGVFSRDDESGDGWLWARQNWAWNLTDPQGVECDADYQVTHWMPLPSAPTAHATTGGDRG